MPSTVIRKFEYNSAERRLDIQFVTGRRYRYHDVPPEIGDAMKQAFSKGEFFNNNIRDRFRFTRQQ